MDLVPSSKLHVSFTKCLYTCQHDITDHVSLSYKVLEQACKKQASNPDLYTLRFVFAHYDSVIGIKLDLEAFKILNFCFCFV